MPTKYWETKNRKINMIGWDRWDTEIRTVFNRNKITKVRTTIRISNFINNNNSTSKSFTKVKEIPNSKLQELVKPSKNSILINNFTIGPSVNITYWGEEMWIIYELSLGRKQESLSN